MAGNGKRTEEQENSRNAKRREQRRSAKENKEKKLQQKEVHRIHQHNYRERQRTMDDNTPEQQSTYSRLEGILTNMQNRQDNRYQENEESNRLLAQTVTKAVMSERKERNAQHRRRMEERDRDQRIATEVVKSTGKSNTAVKQRNKKLKKTQQAPLAGFVDAFGGVNSPEVVSGGNDSPGGSTIRSDDSSTKKEAQVKKPRKSIIKRKESTRRHLLLLVAIVVAWFRGL